MLWAIRSDTIGANLPCLHLRPLQESVHQGYYQLDLADPGVALCWRRGGRERPVSMSSALSPRSLGPSGFYVMSDVNGLLKPVREI